MLVPRGATRQDRASARTWILPALCPSRLPLSPDARAFGSSHQTLAVDTAVRRRAHVDDRVARRPEPQPWSDGGVPSLPLVVSSRTIGRRSLGRADSPTESDCWRSGSLIS